MDQNTWPWFIILGFILLILVVVATRMEWSKARKRYVPPVTVCLCFLFIVVFEALAIGLFQDQLHISMTVLGLFVFLITTSLVLVSTRLFNDFAFGHLHESQSAKKSK